jgi:Domain of unknown function (DUF4193)
MATDYDAPRKTDPDDVEVDSLEALAGRRNDAATAVLDVDEGDLDAFDLPGADLSGEELTVRVVPKQPDEFTCTSCFMVLHRHRLAKQNNDRLICEDCA